MLSVIIIAHFWLVVNTLIKIDEKDRRFQKSQASLWCLARFFAPKIGIFGALRSKILLHPAFYRLVVAVRGLVVAFGI